MSKIKWRVTIPAPSAKRMADSGKVFIQTTDGWCPNPVKQLPYNGEPQLEFEVHEGFEWSGDTSCNDGANFRVVNS